MTPPVLGDVTVSAAGPCLDVSFTTDEPSSGTVVIQAGGVEVDTPAGAGQTSFDVGIPLGGLPPVDAGDGDGERRRPARETRAASAPFAFTTPVALPPIAITEVLANPAGPEPQQEYVELRNLGDADVSLAGLRLEDSKGGDDLPAETLAAGGYALVVTATYDPDEGSDPAPRAGTLLVRVDTPPRLRRPLELGRGGAAGAGGRGRLQLRRLGLRLGGQLERQRGPPAGPDRLRQLRRLEPHAFAAHARAGGRPETWEKVGRSGPAAQ